MNFSMRRWVTSYFIELPNKHHFAITNFCVLFHVPPRSGEQLDILDSHSLKFYSDIQIVPALYSVKWCLTFDPLTLIFFNSALYDII